MSSARMVIASSAPVTPHPEPEAVVAVGGSEVHQLVGQLVVVLQRVHQGDRLQALLQGGGQGEPQELGVARGQGVVVCGAVDEVVGQVRSARAGARDVVDGQVQLLEGEPADLADQARDQLVGGVGEGMPLRPGRGATLGTLLDPEEAVGIEPQRAGAEVVQGVQRVAHDQPHAGAGGVEPVDRGLTVLEVVQIHPATIHPVDAGDDAGGAPVRLLDAGLVEDHPLHPADDVAGLLQPVLGLRVEVDRVRPDGTGGSRCQSSGGISTMW